MRAYGARLRIYEDLYKNCAARGRREGRNQIKEGLAEIEADRAEERRLSILFDEEARKFDESERNYDEYLADQEPLGDDYDFSDDYGDLDDYDPYGPARDYLEDASDWWDDGW